MRFVSFHRLLIFCSALLAPPCSAMEFTLVGSTLILSGGVVDTDLAKIKDNLDPAKVRLIVLHTNYGGDLWNALRIGERLRESGIHVTTSGTCISACGLIFLGGAKRTYSDGQELKKVVVGLHGTYDKDSKELKTTNLPQVTHYIERMSGGKFPLNLIERVFHKRNIEDVIFFFHQKVFKRTPGGVVECVHDNSGKRICTLISGLDSLSVGVITSQEITILDDEVKERLKSLM